MPLRGRHGTCLTDRKQKNQSHFQFQTSENPLQCIASCLNLTLSLQFTIVLLLRHLVTVVTVGAANQFAFSLLTVSRVVLLHLNESMDASLRFLCAIDCEMTFVSFLA